jgi:FMN phosphatase YigB (HAD superfamily)
VKKIILSDCDGVLLDWASTFAEWMKQHGHQEIRQDVYDIHLRYGIKKAQSKALIRQFNESAAIGFLKPLRDSVEVVESLFYAGYRIRVISSLSLDPWAAKLREQNLRAIFGPAVEQVICLECGADKDEALAPYKDSGLFWIEDKPKNAEVGQELGLKAILVEHEHNEAHPGLMIAKDWKEIYEIIVG